MSVYNRNLFLLFLVIYVLAALRAELFQTEFFSAGLTAQDVVVSSAFFTGEKYGFGLLLAFSHRFTPGSGEPEKRLRLDVNCLSFLTKRERKTGCLDTIPHRADSRQ